MMMDCVLIDVDGCFLSILAGLFLLWFGCGLKVWPGSAQRFPMVCGQVVF
jgi:hypothetical protein